MVCWAPSASASSSEEEQFDKLRAELASISGPVWPTSLGVCAEQLWKACDATTALLSIAGASPDGRTLTILASHGPCSSAASVGRLLPSPWFSSSSSACSALPSGATTTSATRLRPEPTDNVHLPKALSWKSGSELVLPYEWHQILGAVRFSETLTLHACLEPVLLHQRLVGALLVVHYADPLPSYRPSGAGLGALGLAGSAPFISPVTWTGEGAPPAAAAAAASAAAGGSVLSFLTRWRKQKGAGSGSRRRGGRSSAVGPPAQWLRAAASVLSQAVLGPNLQAVSRVCAASQTLSSASSLQNFTATLSYTVAEALAADLFVNLAVRVAVVPPTYGAHGYLLPADYSAAESLSLGPAGSLASTELPLPKRAVSGSLATAVAAPRQLSAVMARTISGREGSTGFGPGGGHGDDRKASPFALPSALLMQLLRPGGGRPGNASVAGSTHAGSCHYRPPPQAFPYHPEEPTVRGFVAQAPSALLSSNADSVNADIFVTSSTIFTDRAPLGKGNAPGPMQQVSAMMVQTSGNSASGAYAGGVSCAAPGGGGVGRPGASGCVSGMVISNLNAWLQDLEKPSSDVALLLMRGRAAGSNNSISGRASQGGVFGAGGSGPACLVVVAGSAPPRGGGGGPAAAASAAAAAMASGPTGHASGSVHMCSGSTAATRRQSADWVRNLEASMRGGLVVDLSIRAGAAGGQSAAGAYGGGSVRYDSGVSCGPCVALYMTATERLPTSLLRAVKERAQALMELLLPACLASLSMGPVRADLERLTNAHAAASGSNSPAMSHSGPGGAGRSRRTLLAPGAGGVGNGASSPIISSPVSGSPLHLQLQQLQAYQGMPAQAENPGSQGPGSAVRLSRAAGVAAAAAAAAAGTGPASDQVPRSLMQLRFTAPPEASMMTKPYPMAPAPVLPQASGVTASGVGGERAPGAIATGGGGGGGGGSSSPLSLSGEISLLAQRKWPGDRAAPAVPPSTPAATAATAAAATVSRITSDAESDRTGPRVLPSPTQPGDSRTPTRGSPLSVASGLTSAHGATVEVLSLDSAPSAYGVLGGCDGGGGFGGPSSGPGGDIVASMRDNLDVWVNSFWGMLKETPRGAGGHTSGSYADSDLRFLRLHRLLGSGGAASVYAGMLLGMDVAVKVIHPPPEIDMGALASARESMAAPPPPPPPHPGPGPEGGSEGGSEGSGPGGRLAGLVASVRQAQMRELMRSARECAVLTTLSHPAIVQVYSYHTRVQVVPGEGPDALPRLLPVPPGEQGDAGPLHSVLIMERCDLGSLADALDGDLFKRAIVAAAHAPFPGGPSAAPQPSNGSGAGSLKPGGSRSYNALFPLGPGAGAVPSPCPSPSPSCGGAAMRAIYLTLLEVALALRHLHSLDLVHCDIKVANVLLKSSASDPRGFTCKLSDFGLVNLLRHDDEEEEEDGNEQQDGEREGEEGGPGATPRGPAARRRSTSKPSMRNVDAAGTVTHLAPECFTPGAPLDASVDVYAFGIVMWEVFTRKPPYAEFAPDFESLPDQVVRGLRPRFPQHCPAPFRALAQACWHGDAVRRPTAASVVTCLQQLLEGSAPRH